MHQTNKEEKRECFWEELGDCIETFKTDERVMVLGDINAKWGMYALTG